MIIDLRRLTPFFHNKELSELYLSYGFRSLALSLISIFIPIYLIKMGYSIQTVILMYALVYAIFVLLIIPVAKFCTKFGPKHSMVLSVIFTVLFYLMLYSLETYNWSIYLIAVIGGIEISFFWTGYHLHLAKASDRENRGKEIGFLSITASLVGIFGPMLGGFIVLVFGFHIAFLIVIGILLLSAIPLLMSQDTHEPFEFHFKDLNDLKFKEFLGYFGIGAEFVVGAIIWPIYIFFFILNNFVLLGSVSSLSMLFSMISMYVAGRLSDINRRLTLKVGSIVTAIVWFVRILVTAPMQVFAIDSFYGIGRQFMLIPFDAINYDNAEKSNIVKVIVFRELGLQYGKIAMLLIFLVLSNYLWVFALGAFSSFLVFFF